MPHNNNQIGIYIHWPFCRSKCPYCDFNSHVREHIDDRRWQDAYVTALSHYAQLLPGREVVSVYFGGGTPSLMPPDTVEAILKRVQAGWSVVENAEITLEANPTSVEAGKFKAFRSAGVNRVSLGVQALNDNDLKFLGREHTAKEALEASDVARQIFDKYSFDLMYARPEQSLKNWEAELSEAENHAGGHLSLYQLTIERATPFFTDHEQGKFSVPDEELAADFYNLTQDILEGWDMPAYEVSNHAKTGQESQHNLIYWRYGEYLGVGPGAHGRLVMNEQKWAMREHRAPEVWLEKVESEGHAAHDFEPIPPRDRFVEALMMGLRLREGVSLDKLEEEANDSCKNIIDCSKIKSLSEQGWLVLEDGRLRPSREGMLRLNAIIPYILRKAAA